MAGHELKVLFMSACGLVRSSSFEATPKLCCYKDPGCSCVANLFLLECLMHAYPCMENANFLLMIGTYIDLAETICMCFTGMHTRLFSAIKGQSNCFKDTVWVSRT